MVMLETIKVSSDIVRVCDEGGSCGHNDGGIGGGDSCGEGCGVESEVDVAAVAAETGGSGGYD